MSKWVSKKEWLELVEKHEDFVQEKVGHVGEFTQWIPPKEWWPEFEEETVRWVKRAVAARPGSVRNIVGVSLVKWEIEDKFLESVNLVEAKWDWTEVLDERILYLERWIAAITHVVEYKNSIGQIRARSHVTVYKRPLNKMYHELQAWRKERERLHE